MADDFVIGGRDDLPHRSRWSESGAAVVEGAQQTRRRARRLAVVDPSRHRIRPAGVRLALDVGERLFTFVERDRSWRRVEALRSQMAQERVHRRGPRSRVAPHGIADAACTTEIPADEWMLLHRGGD